MDDDQRRRDWQAMIGPQDPGRKRQREDRLQVRGATALILALALLLGAPSPAPSGTRLFRSQRYGFSVRYPRSWRLGGGEDSFLVFNFPRSRAVRGAVLPEDGAGININVPEEMASTYAAWGKAPPKSLEDWAAIEAEIHSFHLTQNGHFEASGGGHNIAGIELRGTEGSGTDIMEVVEWFFMVGDRMFLASLSYWQGNANAAELREVLRQMALSVRPIS